MTMLIVGILLFFLPHSVSIINHRWRDQKAQQLGEWGWKGLIGLISLVGFVLMIKGYGDARVTASVLYSPPAVLRHLVLLLMVPVFPLLVSTYLPGRIKSTVKHPTLVATKLWALSHLLVNGASADVLLFGSFLLWAVADRISMKKREVRPIPAATVGPLNDVIAIAAGLGVYAGFVVKFHSLLIGVPLF